MTGTLTGLSGNRILLMSRSTTRAAATRCSWLPRRDCWNSQSIETRLLPTRTRSYPRHFTLITRTARCLRQLPSCVAVYPRDSPSRVFYVAFPKRSIVSRSLPLGSTATFAVCGCGIAHPFSIRERGVETERPTKESYAFASRGMWFVTSSCRFSLLLAWSISIPTRLPSAS